MTSADVALTLALACPVASGWDRPSTAGRGEYAENSSGRSDSYAAQRDRLLDMCESTAREVLVADDSADRSANLAPSQRQLLQAIYDLLRDRGAWPTFRRIDVRLDRNMGIADTQAALASVPAAYLQRP